MGIKPRMVNRILKLDSIFKFKLSYSIAILLKLSALVAIYRFCMQFALKGIRLPFAIALKAISNTLEAAGRYPTTACNTLLYRVFFGFCMR